ncbi:MAG: cupin-like domain-containing protein [Pseudomonadota bacterium]|nr:cupin-like domain-containing protein [Pseudomonadota bacterium]
MYPQPITEWHQVDRATFDREIRPRNQPAVLRGLVRHWPIVQQALQSDAALCAYLAQHDSGHPVDAIMMAPAERGRIFYQTDMRGFNFLRNRVPISTVLEQLTRYANFADPPTVALQSAAVLDAMPGFLAAQSMPLLDPQIMPRIWIGNRVTVPAHIDEAHNLACAVGGRRRFTLFPPEQVGNLYIGPLDFAPTGAPISLVDFRAPDLQRFPRAAAALAVAQVAELEPGDAIYIPTLWWHHVESLADVNVLVNYWWGGSIGNLDRAHSPMDAMLHALLSLQSAEPAVRAAWQAMFAHFVFGEDAAAHIPVARRGVLGEMSADARAALCKRLADKLGG